jgi:acyl-CoA reductase-like NAD-dependent aldehyde dehydrogenase
MVASKAEQIVETVASAPARAEVPAAIAEQFERHQRHLIELAANLIQSGLPETEVRRVIRAAMDSWEAELVDTIITLGGGDRECRTAS